MAIALQSAGVVPFGTSLGTGTTSVTPDLPSGLTDGDICVIIVGNKPDTSTPTTPTDWSLAGTVAGGGGTTGVDTGPTRTTAYFRVKDSSWSTMPAISIASNSSAWAQAFRLSGSGSYDVAASGGADSTTGTAWSVTTGANPGITAGDFLIVGTTIPTDVTTPSQFASHGISIPGVTVGTVTEQSEPETTAGNDSGGFITTAPVTAGTSTGVATITATASGTTTNVRGTSLLVRIREVSNNVTVSPTAIDMPYNGPGGAGGGTPTPVGTSTTVWTTAVTTASASWPAVDRTSPAATLANGDVLVAVSGYNASEATAGVTPPAGWLTALGHSPNGAAGISVFYKVVSDAGSEPTTYTFTPSASARGNVAIRAYRSVDNVTPFDAGPTASGTGNTTANVAFQVTGVTTTTADTYVLAAAAIGASTTGIWQPVPGTTTIADLNGRKMYFVEEGLQASAGPTGDLAFTTDQGNIPWRGFQAALKAGAGAPTDPNPGNVFITAGTGGPTNQTITPTGVATAEAFGTPAYTAPGTGIEFINISTAGSASGTVAPAVPDGTATGDLMLAFVSTDSASNVLTAPNGWLTAINPQDAGTSSRTAMFYRFAGNGETASTFTTTDEIGVTVATYRGVNDATPLDVTTVGASLTGSTNLVLPSITTVTDNCWLVAAVSTDLSVQQTPHYAPPAGWTEREDWETTLTGQVVDTLLDYEAGTAGTKSGHTVVSLDATRTSAAIVVALRPAPYTPPAIGDVVPTSITSGQVVPGPTITGGAVGNTGTVTHRWVGAVSTDGVTVAVKVSSGSGNVRLKVSTAADLNTAPVFGGYVTPTAELIAKPSITGLNPGTKYYYGVEIGGAVDTAKIGSFDTAPSGAASFSFVCGSCANGDSVAFTNARNRNPQLVLHTGDIGYWDYSTNSPANFRSGYDNVMARTNNEALFANVPTVYTWSDHDFGPNNAVGSSASKPAAQQVYRERVPHHTLPSSTDIYHSFMYGRVLILVTDERSNKSANAATDDSSKTMLGATQKQWFKDQITNTTAGLIVWVGDSTWIGAAVASDDDWFAYNTERQELATFMAASGKNIVRIQGDMHALAADNGTNAPGGIDVIAAAPWNQTNSTKGGPYSQGIYSSSTTCYGWVQITDTGGSTIGLQYNGYDGTNTSRITLSKTYNVSAAPTNQTVSPTAIASAEASGSPTISGTTPSQTVSPSAIASAETHGTATIGRGTVTASPGGIPTGEAYGAVIIAASVSVTPSGVATSEAFGTATVSRTITVTSIGVASAEATGTPSVASVITSSPGAIVTAEAFGTAVISRIITSSPTGVASGEAFGTPTRSSLIVTGPLGVASAEAFGTPVRTSTMGISPTGIVTGESVSSATVTTGGVTLAVTGIASAETFGSVVVSSGGTVVIPGSIVDSDTYGNPVISTGGAIVGPSGIVTSEASGTPVISRFVTVAATGLASAEAFGTPSVGGINALSPVAIPSAEALGVLSVALGGVLVSPGSILTAQVFGTVSVSTTNPGQTVTPTSFNDLTVIGTPVLVGQMVIVPVSITSDEAFGLVGRDAYFVGWGVPI